MRSVADTLPTLRDTAPGEPAAPAQEAPTSCGPEGFDPAAVVRALAARNSGPRPHGTAPQDPARPSAPATTTGGREEKPGRDDPTEGAAATARARLAALAARHRARNGPVPEPTPNSARPSPALQDQACEAEAASPSHIPHIDGVRETVEDRIARAVDEARREAETEKERAVEAARDEERADADRRLAEARGAWASEEAALLKDRIDGAFDELHDRLSEACAGVLAGIADKAMRERALRRFASVLDDLVGAGASESAVTVRGPADLIAALRALTGERAAIAFEETSTSEIVATLGDTRIETTIGAWADDLAEVMGVTRGD